MDTSEQAGASSRAGDPDHESEAGSGGIVAVTLALACLAVFIAVVGVAFGMRAIDKAEGGSGSSGSGGSKEVAVSLTDLDVEPASVEVAPGTELTLVVTNNGELPHDLSVEGSEGTAMLDPGASETITVGPFDASSQLWCTVPGHKDAGMTLDVEVTGDAGGGGATATAAGSSDSAEIDFDAEPAEDFVPFDPALQPAPGGTTHDITFSMDEVVMEVAPGVKQQMWTFEGQVPGPPLRGKVGDIFNVTIVNDGEVPHSIDFHSSKVAWNDEMRSINPGESLTYTYEAKHSGIFMYHCGTAPALHHIGNGMYGAVVIDPPDLPPVDHEFIFVQSEFYLGPDGQPGDLTKMQNEEWDAVVFNGYVSQYLNRPIRVEPGQRVRAWVLDAGPSENSSFHIVGTIFDRMFKEGAYRLPAGTTGGAQALDLQPAQGGFVEFTFDEAGLYPIVTHKFANVGKGAIGLFQAGEVETEESSGGH